MNRFSVFVSAMLAVDLLGIVLVALLLPATAREVGFIAVLAVAPVLAYWLAYRGGLAAVGLGGVVDD